MRRSDKKITDSDEIRRILEENEILHLSLSEDNVPYIVPMNYGYEAATETGADTDTEAGANAYGIIYLHSAREGKKLDIMRRNPLAAFEISDSISVVSVKEACSYTTKYRSVIGSGTISIADADEKVCGMNVIMRQHTGRTGWDFPESALDKITVLRIDIHSLTGKKAL